MGGHVAQMREKTYSMYYTELWWGKP